jgi:hypothetical protein
MSYNRAARLFNFWEEEQELQWTRELANSPLDAGKQR